MICILGARGMVGSDFEGDFLRPTRAECDVSDPMNIAGYFDKNKVDAVINCVGFCGAQTESNKIKTHERNVFYTRNIALACDAASVKLVHITTSVAGEGSSYAVSKRYSEHIVRDYCTDYSIVKTGWLFSKNNDKGFLSTVMAHLAQERRMPLYKEVGTPSYAKDVADDIIKNLNNLGKEETISNYGSCSRYEWATEIANILGQKLHHEFVDRKYKTTEDSSLVGHLRSWKSALRACLCDKGFLTQS